MRSIWTGLSTALMVIGLAATSWAQNGLGASRRRMKPQLELKSLTYASAEPLGAAGFILNDVVAVIPANRATGDKEAPSNPEGDGRGARFRSPEEDRQGRRGAALRQTQDGGHDRQRRMFTALQPTALTCRSISPSTPDRHGGQGARPQELEVNMRGQTKITLALVIDGISDKAAAGAKDDGKLRSASLIVDDSGLLDKLLTAYAKEEGTKPEDIVQSGRAAIAAFAEAQGPATLKALDAVASFMADWKAPKGPLALGLKPAKTAGLSDLDKIMLPDALTTVFGFTATYPGSKDGADKAGAAAAK
jgi:hypothetical protein